jgi:hypothetical protein
VNASVRSFEVLFRTEIHEYHSKNINQRRLLRASKALVVPDYIATHVTYFNINSHPLGASLRGTAFHSHGGSNPLDTVPRGRSVTPEFLRALYKIPDTLVANETNAQGKS